MDDEQTAFPASEATPGQAESRSAYARFRAWVGAFLPAVNELSPELGAPDWLRDYLALRAEGWDWRKAAYIAWAASPIKDRWPASQEELAQQVLGLRADRTIRKWRENDPRMDERVAKLQIEPLLKHRRDVLDALIAVASVADPHAHPDRRMYLEMTGDYNPKGQVALINPDGSAALGKGDFSEMGDEELDQVIENLQEAAR